MIEANPKRSRWICPFLFLGLFVLSPSCSREGKQDRDAAVEPAGTKSPREEFVEKGDLAVLKKRGKLRILLPLRKEDELLVREGFAPDLEKDLAERFARKLGLEPVRVYVEKYEDLLPWLQAGKGDLVVASLTVTPERKKLAAFTMPLSLVREQVVTRPDDKKLKKPEDLTGRKVAVRRSSSYFQTLKKLQKKVPGMIIEEVPEHLDTEQVLNGVATGRFDLTVADNDLVRSVRLYTTNLEVAFDLTKDRPTAWAVRPEADGLRKALDEFLGKIQFTGAKPMEHKEDLPGIVKRGVLRVLTLNSAATYFLLRGQLMGFEYELVSEFARQHDLQVKLVVPPSAGELIPWLLEGRGDVIAAALTSTETRKSQGVRFSRPTSFATETVVARADDTGLSAPEQLAGRTVVVRKSSSYWQTLQALKQEGIDLTIEAAPAELNTEGIIAKVAAGEYDLTVADSHILDIELCHRKDIRAACPLGEPVSHGWVVRLDNPKLLAAIDAFVKKEYRGVFYNITYKKYFKNVRNIQKHHESRSTRTGRISPFDDLFKRFSQEYGFDWRLVASQAYAESRFDPKAKSWVGAQGVMQVMPRTARELGFQDVKKPLNGIHAGVKYLARMRERFDPSLPAKVRNWFALASYNAGFGHVLDARRLASGQGWNPDRWFDNVEKAMLLLSRPEFAKKARHGYCRGSEPVNYVRSIQERYQAFVRASP